MDELKKWLINRVQNGETDRVEFEFETANGIERIMIFKDGGEDLYQYVRGLDQETMVEFPVGKNIKGILRRIEALEREQQKYREQQQWKMKMEDKKNEIKEVAVRINKEIKKGNWEEVRKLSNLFKEVNERYI